MDNAPPPSQPVDTLAKPNALIAMKPTRGRLTTISRKVYNSLLLQTQQALAGGDDAVGADGYFEAPLRVLLQDAHIDPSGQNITNVKRYLEEMQSTQVDWLAISASDRIHSHATDGEEVLFDSSGLVYRSKIIRRDGLLWVKWRLPEEIVAALASRENVLWTRLQLQTIAKLSSYTAVALYEICSRYKTHAAGLTSRQSVEWWTDALSQSADGAGRREWRKFKAEKLKPAIDEINDVTDLQIELIEYKQGRAVGEVQFGIKRLPRTVSENKAAPVIDLALFERTRRCGLGDEQTAELCRRFGVERVRSKLRQLEERLAAPGLDKVSSALAYFKTILRSGESPAETVADVLGGETTKPAGGAPANLADAMSQQREQATLSLSARIRAEFDQLGDDERRVFAERALTAYFETNAASGRIRQRIQEGDFDHPMLAGIVFNAFAESRLGKGWQERADELDFIAAMEAAGTMANTKRTFAFQVVHGRVMRAKLDELAIRGPSATDAWTELSGDALSPAIKAWKERNIETVDLAVVLSQMGPIARAR